MTKTCPRCRVVKDVSEFPKNRTTKDGLSSYCKDCYKELYRENREKCKASIQRWRENHPEYSREYSQKNREKINEYRRKKYHEEDPEVRRARDREKAKRNRDTQRENRLRRRKRLREAPGSHTEEQIVNMKMIFGDKCMCCGREMEIRKDHIVPLVMGGSNDISNIQLLCSPCNSKKGLKDTDYRPEWLKDLVALGEI